MKDYKHKKELPDIIGEFFVGIIFGLFIVYWFWHPILSLLSKIL